LYGTGFERARNCDLFYADEEGGPSALGSGLSLSEEIVVSSRSSRRYISAVYAVYLFCAGGATAARRDTRGSRQMTLPRFESIRVSPVCTTSVHAWGVRAVCGGLLGKRGGGGTHARRGVRAGSSNIRPYGHPHTILPSKKTGNRPYGTPYPYAHGLRRHIRFVP
jgi:hypothetical protein